MTKTKRNERKPITREDDEKKYIAKLHYITGTDHLRIVQHEAPYTIIMVVHCLKPCFKKKRHRKLSLALGLSKSLHQSTKPASVVKVHISAYSV